MQVEVTDADREAAASGYFVWCSGNPVILDRIIAGLSEAQRDALLGKDSWASPWDEEEGEAELYRLGLWNPRPKYRENVITPLGLAVRQALKGTDNAE